MKWGCDIQEVEMTWAVVRWNMQKCMYDFGDCRRVALGAHQRSSSKDDAVPCVENDKDTRCETTVSNLSESGMLFFLMHSCVWSKTIFV